MRHPWLLLLVACKTAPSPPPLIDTGWFEDTGDTDSPGGCRDTVVDHSPEAANQSWYWRDGPRISVSRQHPTAYQAYVLDDQGYRVPSELRWREGSLTGRVELGRPLQPETDHLLRIVDCEGTREVPFRTSHLGLPLQDGVSTIARNTYHLDLQGADWVEPGGIAALLTLYFDSPGLLDVAFVTDEQLQLRFTLGLIRNNVVVQDASRGLIPFPTVGFSDKPFFSAEAGQVDLDFSGANIPVYQFAFSGTFSADGQTIGGGAVSGIGDTRFAGLLVGDSAPDAICSLAAGFGVTCTPCPTDQLPYCLPVAIENVQGTLLEDVVLQP